MSCLYFKEKFLKFIHFKVKFKLFSKAQSLMEIILAITIGIILIGGSISLFSLSLALFNKAKQIQQADILLRQTAEAIISLARDNWHNVDNLSTTTEWTIISANNIFNATTCQPLLDFDFNAIDSNYTPGWDTNLNLTYKPSFGFSSGYNAGVASSSIGYHAHINPTSGLDNTPGFEYIDENCQFNLCHRWLGVYYNLGTPASKGWGPGTRITVSLYGKVNTLNKPVAFGLYYYNTAGTQAFHSGLPQLTFAQINSWERKTYTFTLINDIDVTKNIVLFIYGYFYLNNSEGRLWVDNVRLFDDNYYNNCIKTLNNNSYLQSFQIFDVYRDSNGNITQTGGYYDPNTKKIKVNVEAWNTNYRNSLTFYLTRSYNNQVFYQTDWSGGPGQSGPVLNPGNKFDTADSNINYASTTGSIFMTTATTTQASLTSSILDTGVSGGAGFNSLLWKGDLGTGGIVRFQIAFSNSTSGPWTYYGPTSTSDYYQPNPNVSVAFPTTGTASPQNYRYFRYKVFLSTTGTSPRVDDIIINWSP